jgi:hypothetical protein
MICYNVAVAVAVALLALATLPHDAYRLKQYPSQDCFRRHHRDQNRWQQQTPMMLLLGFQFPTFAGSSSSCQLRRRRTEAIQAWQINQQATNNECEEILRSLRRRHLRRIRHLRRRHGDCTFTEVAA